MTSWPPVQRRREDALRLRRREPGITRRVEAAFAAAHPDCVETLARAGLALPKLIWLTSGSLAGAIEAGSAEAFCDFVRWEAQALAARGCAPPLTGALLEHVIEEASASGPEAQLCVLARAAKAELSALAAGGPSPEAPELSDRWVEAYLRAILAGDRRAGLSVIHEAMEFGMKPEDVYVDILGRALQVVGDLWMANRIDVADEHLATMVVEYNLAQLYALLSPAAEYRGAAVLTGVSGEHHQVGANMLADLLDADGWDVKFLGSDVPAAAILQAIEHHQASVLGVSVTMIFNLGEAIDLLEAVRRRFGRGLRLVAGGAAFAKAPRLAAELELDACCGDLREGLATMRAVPPSPREARPGAAPSRLWQRDR